MLDPSFTKGNWAYRRLTVLCPAVHVEALCHLKI